MEKFTERRKLSKKARKKLDSERRKTWDFSPVTRQIPDKTKYNRKKLRRPSDEDSGAFFRVRSEG